MKHTEIIPIRYPLMPAELTIHIEAEDGIVHSVDATINKVAIRFVKNTDGEFATESKHQIDNPI